MTIPLLFLDIDGVLNRDTSNREARKRRLLRAHVWAAGRREAVWLDPADNRRIKELRKVFEVAWGSSWEQDAHAIAEELCVPRPKLTACMLPGDAGSKAPGVVRAAAGRPFVWVDDEVRPEEIAADQPWLLITTDAAQGLTDEHVDEARLWAQSLTAAHH